MGALISAALSWFAANSVARFLAVKLISYTLIVVILPIVLWNLGVDWVETILNWTLSALPQDSYIATFSGLAGWLLIQLNIPQIIQIIVSALVARFLIKIIVR